MNIFSDPSQPIYEIEMERLNILTNEYEKRWDYVRARTVKEAKIIARFIHGQSVKILSVKLDD